MNETKIKHSFVVYTALFGDYDNLQEPSKNYQGCDFICFTNQKQLTSAIWDIKLIELDNQSPSEANRYYKLLYYLHLAKYTQSLYIDANIQLLQDPKQLAKRYLSQYDIAIPQHFLRDCSYQETAVVIRSGRIALWPSIRQTRQYIKDGYPEHFGLTENNVIFRNHNDSVKILMQQWWSQLQQTVLRDQLSLGYVCWKLNYKKLAKINENVRGRGDCFLHHKHKKDTRTVHVRALALIKWIIFLVIKEILFIIKR